MPFRLKPSLLALQKSAFARYFCITGVSFFVCITPVCSQISAPEQQTLAPSLDLPAAPAPQQTPPPPDLAHAGGDISWRKLPHRFLHDQKQIWLFPTKLARGQHLVPALAITGLTAGLIVADSHAMPYFQSHAGNLDDVNDVFDSSITSAVVVGIPATLLLTGYVRHDDHQVDTALLAGLAYANSAVVDLAIKAVTRRKRPSDVPQGGPFTDTFFAGGKSPFKGSSFPSGHAAGAFSVATVIATRYHHHRWVPWLAYGFATAVSLSRISTSSHFPSDVFLGAALGYTITRYQTLRSQE